MGHSCSHVALHDQHHSSCHAVLCDRRASGKRGRRNLRRVGTIRSAISPDVWRSDLSNSRYGTLPVGRGGFERVRSFGAESKQSLAPPDRRGPDSCSHRTCSGVAVADGHTTGLLGGNRNTDPSGCGGSAIGQPTSLEKGETDRSISFMELLNESLAQVRVVV